MRHALFGLLVTVFALPVLAAETLDGTTALAISHAAIGRQLGDLRFTDTAGRRVGFANYRGRPLLVSVVYTACSDTCPTLIENLYPAVEVAQAALGRGSFAVVTIGFDSRRDTPERMRAFARQHGVDLPNWHFLAADQATVTRLAADIGFTFYPSAGGFEHMAQVTIVDQDGAIYQQVYGGVFEPPQIVEPLKDLVFSRRRPIFSVEGLINRVRFLCTVYDPRTGRYYFNYSLFIGIAIGIASFAAVLVALGREWRRAGAARIGNR